MKPLMRSVLFLLIAPGAVAPAIDFADTFEDATLRIDYFHTANASCDEISVDQIYIKDIWAGNPEKLLPSLCHGRGRAGLLQGLPGRDKNRDSTLWQLKFYKL